MENTKYILDKERNDELSYKGIKYYYKGDKNDDSSNRGWKIPGYDELFPHHEAVYHFIDKIIARQKKLERLKEI